MKKVQVLVALFVVVLVSASVASAQYCYTPRCKASNYGRPVQVNKYYMNGTDKEARGKNVEQDKRMDTMQTDINSKADDKEVKDAFREYGKQLTETDKKAETAEKKADDAQAKNTVQDNSLFWTGIIFGLMFLIAFGVGLIGWFLPRHNQQNQNNQNNQGNGNNNYNQPGNQNGGQQGFNTNQQMMFQPQTVVPSHYLQYQIPTVVAGHAPAVAPPVVVPPLVNPPVGNNP